MGSKSGPAPPPPPDYVGFAEAQAGASREITEQQTWANRPDQFNPWGSIEWNTTQVWDPTTNQYVNKWQQQTNLNPESQWALDNQMYLQGARSELGGTLMDRAATEFTPAMDWSQFQQWGAPADVYQMDPVALSGQIDTSGMQQIDMPGMVGTPQTGSYAGMAGNVNYGPSGAYSTYGSLGQYDTRYGPEGQYGTQFGPTGAYATQTGSGERDVRWGPEGAMGTRYGPEGAFSFNTGPSVEGVQSSIGATPEELRQRAEDAIYGKMESRLDPQWDQDQEQLREQLLSQGLREGDAAYDRAMDNFARQRTDAYEQAQYQAIVGGGEEAQRNYDQLMGQAGLYNQAMQQRFGQGAQASEIYNAAMQQGFTQEQAAAQAYNAANQQTFQQNQAASAMYNEAMNQGFTQEQAAAQLFNSAMEQGFGQDQAAAQLYNAAMQQGFDQEQAAAQLFNAAQQQGFSQEEAQAMLENAQQQQMFQQELQASQQFNQAAQQKFDQEFGVEGQQFLEGMQQAQFQTAQMQQQYQQQMGLREQQFLEAAKQRGMTNEAALQAWQSERAQYDTMFSQQMQQATMQNELRMNQISEEMQRRGFTLNEINALISGQQVSNPSFAGFSQAQASETPQYLTAANNAYQGALQSYSIDQANDPMGDLFQMGGQLGGAFMMSDRRLKTNVRKVGETPAGINVYAFDYVWGESAIGVMADEVPHAAVMTPSGYYAVDYSKVT